MIDTFKKRKETRKDGENMERQHANKKTTNDNLIITTRTDALTITTKRVQVFAWLSATMERHEKTGTKKWNGRSPVKLFQ